MPQLVFSPLSSFSAHRRELWERPKELLGAAGANHSKGDLMEEGHARGADEIELIPDLAFQQGRESGTPELAPDRVPPDTSTSPPKLAALVLLPALGNTSSAAPLDASASPSMAARRREASQTLTHRNSMHEQRDAAAPTTLFVAAEQLSSARAVLPRRWPARPWRRRPSSDRLAPPRHLQWGRRAKLSFPSTLNSTWMGIWTEWH